MSDIPVEEVGKQARSKITPALRIIVLTIAGVVLLTFGAVWYLLYADSASPRDHGQVMVTVSRNSTANAVTDDLYDQGLIRSKFLFNLAIKIFGADTKLHAGLFDIPKSSSIKQIIDILTERNGTSSMITFTIPEGYSLQEIAQILEDNLVIGADDFLQYAQYGAVGELSEKYPFLSGNPGSSLEGYLFPDTYKVARGLSAHQLADIMLDQFNRTMYQYYVKNKEMTPETRNGTPLSFHELVTLASIVEKEAVVDRERPIIAEVFINRLKRNMHLGACPTVKYALNQPRKPQVTFKDIEVDSPYNTYRYLGLPPGPIASPGIESFRAVLHPSDNTYLYFIAKGDGTHIFSYNQAQHNQLRGQLGFDSLPAASPAAQK